MVPIVIELSIKALCSCVETRTTNYNNNINIFLHRDIGVDIFYDKDLLETIPLFCIKLASGMPESI